MNQSDEATADEPNNESRQLPAPRICPIVYTKPALSSFTTKDLHFFLPFTTRTIFQNTSQKKERKKKSYIKKDGGSGSIEKVKPHVVNRFLSLGSIVGSQKVMRELALGIPDHQGRNKK